MAKYILKNTTKRDINLGDLRYKIPAGKSRNLLSPTAHLKFKEIEKSRTSGSISKYLGRGLVEVESDTTPKLPPKEESKSVVFPQKLKSAIVVDMSDIVTDEELKDTTSLEDEEELKKLQLESEQEMQELPKVVKGE